MRISKTISVFFFGSIFCLFNFVLSGCGELKRVANMEEKTGKMEETTRGLRGEMTQMNERVAEMAATTKGLAKDTAGVRQTTDLQLIPATNAIFDIGRQGQAETKRDDKLKEIQRTARFEERIASAGLYLSSFEFQLLGRAGDDPQLVFRDLLYQQATLEFFHRMKGLAPRLNELDLKARPAPLCANYGATDGSGCDENRASAFNAIAVTLHLLNREQAPDPRFGRALSMYDLIMIALKSEEKINRGEIPLPAGPHFIKEVLLWKPLAIQILATRHNLFPFFFVGARSDFGDFGMLKQAWLLYFPTLKIPLDVSKNSVGGLAALQKIRDEILVPAVQTARDLKALGVDTSYQGVSARLTQRIRFEQPRILVSKASGSTDPGSITEAEIKSLWSELINGSTSSFPVPRSFEFRAAL